MSGGDMQFSVGQHRDLHLDFQIRLPTCPSSPRAPPDRFNRLIVPQGADGDSFSSASSAKHGLRLFWNPLKDDQLEGQAEDAMVARAEKHWAVSGAALLDRIAFAAHACRLRLAGHGLEFSELTPNRLGQG
ncbi:hypothetical protein ZWY2020_025781 [Hordeum vulgare]|nr:hypothetical protein ZWY2020_025781 [Hordeum vulgare]